MPLVPYRTMKEYFMPKIPFTWKPHCRGKFAVSQIFLPNFNYPRLKEANFTAGFPRSIGLLGNFNRCSGIYPCSRGRIKRSSYGNKAVESHSVDFPDNNMDRMLFRRRLIWVNASRVMPSSLHSSSRTRQLQISLLENIAFSGIEKQGMDRKC